MIILGVIAVIGILYFGFKGKTANVRAREPFCGGKWNPDMLEPVTEPLQFPFPGRRLLSWYLPEYFWGSNPRFDYGFKYDTSGKLTPVWPNIPIRPRIETEQY